MQVRLLLGPAGSGKTFRCLSEARQALSVSPEGPPLLLVAPKQGTYQLEQQLLATPRLAGYTRLSIVSFETLARLVFERFGRAVPAILSEEGRVMVLRALLAEKRQELKLFRASARLTGFAQQLSQVLGELQHSRLTPALLNALAKQMPTAEGLSFKLQDLATLLEHYLEWLAAHQLQDQEALLKGAADLLRGTPPSLAFAHVWVDGFAEFSDLELQLLCALLPWCERAGVTFCLDRPAQYPWVSHWSQVHRSFEKCRKQFSEVPNAEVITESLILCGTESRFSNAPVLRHLEQCWNDPRPFQAAPTRAAPGQELAASLRLVLAADREGEVVTAAREILSCVRAGGRFRDVSVIVRRLELYQHAIQRVFSRYGIPFFLDRRESVSHHPLAELTRGAVRAAAFGWQHADWFAALKSGLVPAEEEDIDLLENEALARGWTGPVWRAPIQLKGDLPKNEEEKKRLELLEARLERIRRDVVPAFEKFYLASAGAHNRLSGVELAAAIRELWSGLEVQRRLEGWSAADVLDLASTLTVHETIWRQMNVWLDNAELAFPRERLSLREWLPILEAGLAGLTVGAIPPALDQVLVGAVDRSRTPEVKLGLVLGLNETVFPAAPESAGLLTETDRLELEKREVVLGTSVRRQIGRERYLSYIACTRPRERLVLTWAASDPSGATLNPSSLISHVCRLFPGLEPEPAPTELDWQQSLHRSELGTLVCVPGAIPDLRLIQPEPVPPARGSSLDPSLAAQLYGPVLRTSVSRVEQFAACPFRFFVHSGLRAEERQLFDLDVKEQGSFQHEVLAQFHDQLCAEGKRWRDVSPAQARERVGKIAQALSARFRGGLLESNEQARFTARVLAGSLQDFVETLVGWMQVQYKFDPVKVELAFGEDHGSPPWGLDLGGGNRLELRGRIDRIDLCRQAGDDTALCAVIDYKSSQKQLDAILVQHGIQLQLLAYLNVLRQWPNPRAAFGVGRLQPAGVFYVNLRGKYGREPNRRAALLDPQGGRALAYRHAGRFDLRALPLLDGRPGAVEGDQFNYRLTVKGGLYKRCKEPVTTAEFTALLEQVETNLRRMGQQVYAGEAAVRPYRKGAITACDQCVYRAICRIDPWTHRFRVLRPMGNDENAEAVPAGDAEGE